MAQRWALFCPALDLSPRQLAEAADATGRDPAAEGLRRLRAAWCKRIRELAELPLPWRTLSAADRCVTARFCPPVGTAHEGAVLQCCRLRCCPYCWARDTVSGLYDSLADTDLPPLIYDYRRDVPFRLDERFGNLRLWTAEGLAALLAEDRREVFDASGAVGGWETRHLTVDPERIVLRCRGVLLCERPPRPGLPDLVLRAWERRRGWLPRLVARAAAYHGWWLRGDPELVRGVLDALARRRTTATYGVLRGTLTGRRARRARFEDLFEPGQAPPRRI